MKRARNRSPCTKSPRMEQFRDGTAPPYGTLLQPNRLGGQSPVRETCPREPVDPPPAVIGLSPPVRGLKPIPEDIDEHLVDFCTRYWEPLEEIAKKRMREVGVPEERSGMLDVDNDYRLAVFHPKQLDGGGVHPPTGRINLD